MCKKKIQPKQQLFSPNSSDDSSITDLAQGCPVQGGWLAMSPPMPKSKPTPFVQRNIKMQINVTTGWHLIHVLEYFSWVQFGGKSTSVWSYGNRDESNLIQASDTWSTEWKSCAFDLALHPRPPPCMKCSPFLLLFLTYFYAAEYCCNTGALWQMSKTYQALITQTKVINMMNVLLVLVYSCAFWAEWKYWISLASSFQW